MATPRGVSRFPKEEQIRRFLLLVEQTEACWQWKGKKHPRSGYGVVSVDGRFRRAHCRAYELLVGPIPEGLELDHLCRNHGCVNPAHLEPVTHLENVRRGDSGRRQREKTHCSQGHEFTAENTYTWTQPNGNERRGCRACRRAANRRFENQTLNVRIG